MKELIYHRHLLPAIERFPSRTLVIDGDYRATYREHGARVLRCAGALRKLGSGQGRPLRGDGGQLPPVPRALPRRLPRRRRSSTRSTCGSPARSSTTSCATRAPRSRSSTATSPPPSTRRCTRPAARARSARTVLIGDGGPESPHDLRYEELLAASEPEVPDEPEEDDPVVLMYTGGTTGLPKGVLVEPARRDAQLVPPGDGVPDRRGAGLPAADADLPRRVDDPRSWRCPRSAARW